MESLIGVIECQECHRLLLFPPEVLWPTFYKHESEGERAEITSSSVEPGTVLAFDDLSLSSPVRPRDVPDKTSGSFTVGIQSGADARIVPLPRGGLQRGRLVEDSQFRFARHAAKHGSYGHFVRLGAGRLLAANGYRVRLLAPPSAPGLMTPDLRITAGNSSVKAGDYALYWGSSRDWQNHGCVSKPQIGTQGSIIYVWGKPAGSITKQLSHFRKGDPDRGRVIIVISIGDESSVERPESAQTSDVGEHRGP